MSECFDLLIRGATVLHGTGSLAPAPVRMRAPVTPPLDLLDSEGRWFRFPSFGAYIEELRARPAAINCAPLVGHTTLRVVTLDSVPAGPAAVPMRRSIPSSGADVSIR